MRETVTALSLLLLLAAGPARPVELLEHAIEAELGGITLPRGAAGTVIVKACAACDVRSLRASAETRYYLAGAALPLAELVREIERLSLGAGTPVGVFYEPGSNRVTRIKVFAETAP